MGHFFWPTGGDYHNIFTLKVGIMMGFLALAGEVRPNKCNKWPVRPAKIAQGDASEMRIETNLCCR